LCSFARREVGTALVDRKESIVTTWTAADLPDLTGKTVVITGASGGIGLVTARELARVGARVVLAVRNTGKGDEVARTISGTTEVRELDVSDLASVRAFARAWTGEIDILINNAGIMQVPRAYTADGFESQAATNYLGPFVLTNLMLPHITGRVVTISSQLHRLGHVQLADLSGRKRRYNKTFAYCDAKLNVTLFALELNRRLAASGSAVTSVVAHPGIASTNLISHVGGISGVVRDRLQRIYNDVEHGALPTLYAATQDIPGGSYVGPDGLGSIKGYPVVRKSSRTARKPETARALWEATAALTGTTTDVSTAPARPTA
jgi:NAD(P)-dependent dehydrogenase (short-subunit alcohol dehydrogenase family)